MGSTEPTILHTDQGSVYASVAYNELIKDMNITRSMSQAGKPTDNPVNESLNGWIKEELFIDFKFQEKSDRGTEVHRKPKKEGQRKRVIGRSTSNVSPSINEKHRKRFLCPQTKTEIRGKILWCPQMKTLYHKKHFLCLLFLTGTLRYCLLPQNRK